MPGKLFGNDFRLDVAYGEGQASNPAANPHVAGAPEADAYDAGAAAPTETMAAPRPGGEEPNSEWLKADIQAWLTDAGIDYPSDATKAELLLLVP